MPNVIKVQKIPKKTLKADELVAIFCYYFPAYTFQKARLLPYKYLKLMLKMAHKEHARKMLELVQIVAAPHTKRGKMIKSLTDKYNAIINE